MLVSVALCQRNETAAFYASHDRSHHAKQKLDFLYIVTLGVERKLQELILLKISKFGKM